MSFDTTNPWQRSSTMVLEDDPRSRQMIRPTEAMQQAWKDRAESKAASSFAAKASSAGAVDAGTRDSAPKEGRGDDVVAPAKTAKDSGFESAFGAASAVKDMIPVDYYKKIGESKRPTTNKIASGAVKTVGSLIGGLFSAVGLGPVGKAVSGLADKGADALLDVGCFG